jgi:uncharacterized protein YnzC (UPF0291/DUF896 family)
MAGAAAMKAGRALRMKYVDNIHRKCRAHLKWLKIANNGGPEVVETLVVARLKILNRKSRQFCYVGALKERGMFRITGQ